MDQDTRQRSLTTNRVDGLTSLARGVLGAAPFVGSVLAEIVGHVIPNQRVDRIVEFVRLLDERIQQIEKDFVKTRMQEPGNVDLLEDAFIQASRATTQERLRHIANIVVKGLSTEDMNQTESKRMLWLIGQLNDAEIVLLRSRLATTREDYERDAAYQTLHSKLLAPDATHLGSTEDELEAAALISSYRQHLHDLGLMRQRFKKPKRGEFPEFDEKTGMMKESGSDVTRMGKMFLRYLDLIPDWYQY
jgi:hypothetical protein